MSVDVSVSMSVCVNCSSLLLPLRDAWDVRGGACGLACGLDVRIGVLCMGECECECECEREYEGECEHTSWILLVISRRLLMPSA